MQPVEFLSVNEEDTKHAQFICTKKDFVNVQSLPIDVAYMKNGKNILFLYTYRTGNVCITF